MNAPVGIQYLIVPTNLSGSNGRFTTQSNNLLTDYTFSGLAVSENGVSVTVNFRLNNNNTDYSITAFYNSQRQDVNTTFNTTNPNTLISSATFSATPDSDPSLASFSSGNLTGILNQLAPSLNSLNGQAFLLDQRAAGTSTTLSGNSGGTRDWLRRGGPILCQAYVASLVNSGTNVNAAIMIDAIGIAIAGLFA
jgi:hypothetical protein